MRERVRLYWASRTRRERLIVAVMLSLLVAALYAWFVQSAHRARDTLRPNVTALRAQAARLEQQAEEIQRLRAAPARTSVAGDLRALVESQAGASGLTRAVVRIEAAGEHQVQIAFGAVRFADWLAWITVLQSQHVRIVSSRVEAMTAPGLVSVTATLSRAAPK